MKKTNFSILPFLFLALFSINCGGQTKSDIITGADQTNEYFPYLEGKNVALTINHSSVIGGTPILDSLMSLGIKVIIAFGPEHGIAGNASAGAPIENDIDEKTGIPVISLYGDHYKPTPEDLAGVDVMIYDIQDVGVRFYTYSVTLLYVMEACAENNVEVFVLDRPNPNDFYVDGPVLEKNLNHLSG